MIVLPNRAAMWRILPFAVFILMLALRGVVADGDPSAARWLYGVAIALVGGLLLWGWREYGEFARQLRPNVRETALAVAVGLVVCALWIRLDEPWMRIGEPVASFRPVDAQGNLIWSQVALRWLGATLVVPVMEELFWRSFLMRWIERVQFQSVPPRAVGLRAIVLSTFVFTLAHTLWLAGAIAGLAYAWLYVRTGKLWVAVIAHAVTNAVLGAWVVALGHWAYW